MVRPSSTHCPVWVTSSCFTRRIQTLLIACGNSHRSDKHTTTLPTHSFLLVFSTSKWLRKITILHPNKRGLQTILLISFIGCISLTLCQDSKRSASSMSAEQQQVLRPVCLHWRCSGAALSVGHLRVGGRSEPNTHDCSDACKTEENRLEA